MFIAAATGTYPDCCWTAAPKSDTLADPDKKDWELRSREKRMKKVEGRG